MYVDKRTGAVVLEPGDARRVREAERARDAREKELARQAREDAAIREYRRANPVEVQRRDWSFNALWLFQISREREVYVAVGKEFPTRESAERHLAAVAQDRARSTALS